MTRREDKIIVFFYNQMGVLKLHAVLRLLFIIKLTRPFVLELSVKL